MVTVRKKQAQSEKLLPTQAALREAIMRANYQALIQSLDSVPSPDLPPPQEYGWKLEDDQWVPMMSLISSANLGQFRWNGAVLELFFN